jgi:hypothetical protein
MRLYAHLQQNLGLLNIDSHDGWSTVAAPSVGACRPIINYVVEN